MLKNIVTRLLRRVVAQTPADRWALARGAMYGSPHYYDCLAFDRAGDGVGSKTFRRRHGRSAHAAGAAGGACAAFPLERGRQRSRAISPGPLRPLSPSHGACSGLARPNEGAGAAKGPGGVDGAHALPAPIPARPPPWRRTL